VSIGCWNVGWSISLLVVIYYSTYQIIAWVEWSINPHDVGGVVYMIANHIRHDKSLWHRLQSLWHRLQSLMTPCWSQYWLWLLPCVLNTCCPIIIDSDMVPESKHSKAHTLHHIHDLNWCTIFGNIIVPINLYTNPFHRVLISSTSSRH